MVMNTEVVLKWTDINYTLSAGIGQLHPPNAVLLQSVTCYSSGWKNILRWIFLLTHPHSPFTAKSNQLSLFTLARFLSSQWSTKCLKTILGKNTNLQQKNYPLVIPDCTLPYVSSLEWGFNTGNSNPYRSHCYLGLHAWASALESDVWVQFLNANLDLPIESDVSFSE